MTDRYDVAAPREFDPYNFHQDTAPRPLVEYGPGQRGDWRASAPTRQIGDITVVGDIYGPDGRPITRYSEAFRALAPMSQEMMYDSMPWLVPPASRTSYRPQMRPPTYDPYNYHPGSDGPQPPSYYPNENDPYSFHPGAPGGGYRRPSERPPTYYPPGDNRVVVGPSPQPGGRDRYIYHPGSPNDTIPTPPSPERPPTIPPGPPSPEYNPTIPPGPPPDAPIVAPPQPEVRPAPSPYDERPCQPCRPQPYRPCQPRCNWYPGKIAGGVIRRVFGGRCR